VDFVEICNVYVGKMVIKAAKRIFNSDKICCSYSDLNLGVTFFGTQCKYVVHLTFVPMQCICTSWWLFPIRTLIFVLPNGEFADRPDSGLLMFYGHN